MTKTEVDLIILGAGPAGMFASTMCGMVGLKSAIVDCADQLGGQCIKVYPEKYIFDVPGIPKILAKDLVSNLEEQMMRFGPKVFLNAEVRSIKNDGENFILTDLNLAAPVLMVSSGNGTIKPIRPIFDKVSELENKGYIRYTLSDLESFRDKVVVVAGGGDSALDWCLALHAVGASKIYLVHRRNRLRGAGSLQQEVVQLASVEMRLGYDIKDIQEKEGKISVLFDESSIDADYFIPCYGVQGDKNFLETLDFQVEKDLLNRIVVNPTTGESSCQRLYGVGDACIYDHRRQLISVGFAEGANAAHHARENYFNDRPFILEHSSSMGLY